MSPKIRKPLKRSVKIAGTVVVAGTVILGGMKVAEFRRLSAAKKHTAYVEAVSKSRVPVRNTNQWAKISQVYKLNPTNAIDSAWIRHIEGVSKKTKISVPRVLLTLEQNIIKQYQIKAINTKITSVNNRISKLQLNKNAKGATGRNARSWLPRLIEERARLNRVTSVLSATLAGNPEMLKTQISKMRKTSGSKTAMGTMSK